LERQALEANQWKTKGSDAFDAKNKIPRRSMQTATAVAAMQGNRTPPNSSPSDSAEPPFPSPPQNTGRRLSYRVSPRIESKSKPHPLSIVTTSLPDPSVHHSPTTESTAPADSINRPVNEESSIKSASINEPVKSPKVMRINTAIVNTTDQSRIINTLSPTTTARFTATLRQRSDTRTSGNAKNRTHKKGVDDLAPVESAYELLEEQIGMFTLAFNDPDIEDEYQRTYVAKCSGKFASCVAISMITQGILTIIQLILFAHTAIWLLGISITVMLIQGVILVLTLSKKASDHSLTTSVLPSKLSIDLNYQLLWPFIILSMYGAALIQLIAFNGRFEYVFPHVYVILMLIVLFTRLRFVILVSISVFIVLSFHVIVAVIDSNVLADSKYTTLYYMIFMVAGNTIVGRRMEKYIRKNYMLKKDLVAKKFEIDDMRARSEKLLYKLLPKAVVDRIKSAPDKEIADTVENAGVMFISICNFKDIEVNDMNILNEMISRFDRMVNLFNIPNFIMILDIFNFSDSFVGLT